MQYNKMGNTGIEVSAIGLGCEHLVNYSYDRIEPIIRAAIDNGINILDIFLAQSDVRSNIGKALGDDRKRVILQGHIGSIMEGEQPTQTREIKQTKFFFEDFMKRMNTDYVDIGFIHFVDTERDFQTIFEGDIIKYATKLKQDGTIRAIGLSTHSADIALKAVETGIIDVLMFGINPAFDLMPKEQHIFDLFKKAKQNTENWYCMELTRQKLYDTCKSKGVGVVAMKPLGGGILLIDRLSPFGKGMSVSQCIQYALSNTVVSTAMVGCRRVGEVEHMLEYMREENDGKGFLSILSNSPVNNIKGKCMYCNHCLPCPASIDIAAVSKYLDLASINENNGVGIIKDHYKSLEKNATHCIECGSCESKCPFEVKVIENMKRARELFV